MAALHWVQMDCSCQGHGFTLPSLLGRVGGKDCQVGELGSHDHPCRLLQRSRQFCSSDGFFFTWQVKILTLMLAWRVLSLTEKAFSLKYAKQCEIPYSSGFFHMGTALPSLEMKDCSSRGTAFTQGIAWERAWWVTRWGVAKEKGALIACVALLANCESDVKGPGAQNLLLRAELCRFFHSGNTIMCIKCT